MTTKRPQQCGRFFMTFLSETASFVEDLLHFARRFLGGEQDVQIGRAHV
jgi:hypothetical protein